MARIDLGSFGFATPDAVRGPRVQDGPGIGQGLQQLGTGIEKVADEMYKEEAQVQATQGVLNGKEAMDEFRVGYEASPVDAAGRPRFDSVVKEFDKHAATIKRDVLKGTTNKLARQVIEKDLTGYLETTRRQLLSKAQQDRSDAQKASVLSAYDDMVTNSAGVPEDETMKRVGQLLFAGIKAGAVSHEDAVKMNDKARKELAFADYTRQIAGAETLPQLMELRGRLATEALRVGTERYTTLQAQINQKVADIDKQSDREIEARKERIGKMFEDSDAAGRLTITDVQQWKNDLPAERYSYWIQRAENSGKRQVEGRDDASTALSLQQQINAAYNDPVALRRLRTKVEYAAYGYDPVTRTMDMNRRLLSQRTAREMFGDIDSHLGHLSSEGRQQTSETRTEQDRRFAAVRATVEKYAQAYTSGLSGDELAASKRTVADIEAEMLRNKTDPERWLDGLKKGRPEFFKPRPPPFVPLENGKPNWQAAKERAYRNYMNVFNAARSDQAKRDATAGYQSRIKQIDDAQKAWNDAQP